MTLDLRDLGPRDAPALGAFFRSMPPQDRTFFFQDVQDPDVAQQWVSDDRGAPRGAFDERGVMLGFAALKPGVDWSSHVADVVLVVSPDARRSGLGRTLARAMLTTALERGFTKVTVVIPVANTAAVEMFGALGFATEALLRSQLRSPEDGELHDVVILAHLVSETRSAPVTGADEEAVG